MLTGDEKQGWSATFLGQRVNFYQNSGIPFDRYDKISRTWNLTLPGGTVLPFSLRRETWKSYATAELSIDPASARAMLEERLLTKLGELLGETGEEVSHSFSAGESGGMLVVTLTAECREELGRFVPAE